jgi:hypothetical protein
MKLNPVGVPGPFRSGVELRNMAAPGLARLPAHESFPAPNLMRQRPAPPFTLRRHRWFLAEWLWTVRRGPVAPTFAPGGTVGRGHDAPKPA